MNLYRSITVGFSRTDALLRRHFVLICALVATGFATLLADLNSQAHNARLNYHVANLTYSSDGSTRSYDASLGALAELHRYENYEHWCIAGLVLCLVAVVAFLVRRLRLRIASGALPVRVVAPLRAGNGNESVARLEALRAAHEHGHLTAEEYDQRKARLLDEI